MPKGEPKTKVVEGVEIEEWHLAPILIPSEIRTEIIATAKDHNMTLAEFVLVASIRLAGYDDETAMAAQRLCYPKGNRESAETDNSTVTADEPQKEK